MTTERERLLEQGRRLASEREDLIAAGINPTELAIPLAPLCGCWDKTPHWCFCFCHGSHYVKGGEPA